MVAHYNFVFPMVGAPGMAYEMGRREAWKLNKIPPR